MCHHVLISLLHYYFFDEYDYSGLLNLANCQRVYSQRRRMRDWMRRMRKSMEIPYVGHVERTMLQMSSGFVVTYVRNGSMENVWKSLQPGLSTSSSTSVPPAATRELGLDTRGGFILCKFLMLKSVNYLVGQIFCIMPCWPAYCIEYFGLGDYIIGIC